jgi:hypothetical protein
MKKYSKKMRHKIGLKLGKLFNFDDSFPLLNIFEEETSDLASDKPQVGSFQTPCNHYFRPGRHRSLASEIS